MRGTCNNGRIVFTAGYTLDEVNEILRAYTDEELIRVARELRGGIIDAFIEYSMARNYIRMVGLENPETSSDIFKIGKLDKIDEWDEYFRERKKEAMRSE